MPRDFTQSSTQFLSSIDAEIERLQSLRQQVAAVVDADEELAKPAESVRKGMSAEGRRKIAEAQKARWAKQKKVASSVAKAPAKRSVLRRPLARKLPLRRMLR